MEFKNFNEERLHDAICRHSMMPDYWNINHFKWKYSLFLSEDDLRDKTVLEIGCSEGFFSLLAKIRGAKKVVSIDTYPEFVKTYNDVCQEMNLDCECHLKSLYDIDDWPLFDVVIYSDVCYHIEDPMLGFRKCFQKTGETMFFGSYILEERFLPHGNKRVMYMFEPFELHPSDHTNVWGPSWTCLDAMIMRSGFSKIEWLGESESRVLAKCYR